MDENLQADGERAAELANLIGDLLNGEADLGIVLWVLAFLSGMACDAVAEETGGSLDEVAAQFVEMFEEELPRAAFRRSGRLGVLGDQPEILH